MHLHLFYLFYDFNAIHKWTLLSSILRLMRDYYFSAELQSCQAELKQADLEVNWPDCPRGRGCTDRSQVWQKAFRQWPSTFHWFHRMSLGTLNWLLPNCLSAAQRMDSNHNVVWRKRVKWQIWQELTIQEYLTEWIINTSNRNTGNGVLHSGIKDRH